MSARLLAAWIVARLFTGTIFASDEIERLKSEAITAWRKLDVATSQVEGTCTQSAPSTDKPAANAIKLKFLVRGEDSWFNVENIGAGIKAGSRHLIYGRTSKYDFLLKPGSGGKGLLLHSFDSPAAPVDERMDAYRKATAQVAWAFQLRNLMEVMSDSQFKLDRMQRDSNDPNLVHMAGRFASTNFKGTRREFVDDVSFTTILDPSLCWALRSYDCKIKRTQGGDTVNLSVSGTIDYRANSHYGLPIPARLTYVLRYPELSPNASIDVTDFENWRYRSEISDQEVGLAAFGIPEPAVSRAAKVQITTFVWLSGASIAFGILAIALKRIARRRTESTVNS